MKHFYFMNKEEVIDADNYENPDGPLIYHYKRTDRTDRRRQSVLSTPQSATIKRKRRRIIYFIDLIIIIGIFIYWQNTTKKEFVDEFVEAKTWKYYLRLTPPESGERELILYIKNILSETKTLKRSYHIAFSVRNKEEILIEKNQNIPFNKDFQALEMTNLTSIKFKMKEYQSADRVRVVINDKMTLVKQLKLDSTD